MLRTKKGWLSQTLVACGVLLVTAPAQAVLVDYNAPGDLAANFNFNHNGAGNKYSEAPSGGLQGTRAVDVAGAVDAVHTTAAYNPRSFPLAGMGDAISVSQFVLRKPHLLYPINFSFMHLGALSNETERLGISSAPDSYVSLRVLTDPDVNDARVFLQSEVKTSASSRIQDVIAGETADLIDGHWYKFIATFEYVSTTEVLITGALEDWGSDGAGVQSTVLELTPLNPQSLVDLSGLGGTSVLGDSAVWAGWRGFDEGGAELFDDFSAVPEPATLVLFSLGGIALLGRRR